MADLKFTKVSRDGLTDYHAPLPDTMGEHYGVTPTTACVWYDRQTRCWVAYLVSDEHYQSGSSEYVYTKDEAMDAATAMWLERRHCESCSHSHGQPSGCWMCPCEKAAR